MAVVTKKRKHVTTYYVVTWFQGAAYNERSGTDKREAQRLDKQRKREVKQGTFRPNQKTAEPTVAEYGTTWGAARRNISAPDDRRNLGRFLALPEFAGLKIEEVRPRHIMAALEQLKIAGKVKLKSLQNSYGALNTMFRDAQIAELVTANPCVLPRGYFADEDPKERESYTRTETAVLVSHHKIPEPIRVLLALCLLGGMREGEACGRRWSDLDQAPTPLWALEVGTQYGGRALKTKKRRVVPVHPDLQRILEHWARVGFVQLMGRAPTPEDYIVPNVSRWARAPHHTKSSFSKLFTRKALKVTGIPNKTLHSTRHTMITLARRGGGDKAVVSKVTHNAKGDIVDRYTHRDWSELCAAVLAIGSLFDSPPPNGPDFDARPSLHLTGEIAQETASGNQAAIPRIDVELPAGLLEEPTSIPGASTLFERKKWAAPQARQHFWQRALGAELRGPPRRAAPSPNECSGRRSSRTSCA